MRQRIISAAGRLFAERGYAGTSVRDIARELGISNPSIYHHFASKAEVLDEVLREPMEIVGRSVERAAALPGAERRRAVVEGLLESLEVHGGVALVALDGSAHDTRARTLAEAGLLEVAALLGPTADQGGEADPLALVMAMAAVEGAVRHLWRQARTQDDFVRLMRERRPQLAETALRVLGD